MASAITSLTPPRDKELGPGPRIFFPFSVLWFAIIALEIALLAPLRIVEADIWFHLRNAQELLTTHSFLRVDRHLHQRRCSVAQSRVALRAALLLRFRAWVSSGLVVVYLVLLWLIFAGVYYIALRRGANYGDAALVTMAGVALGSYDFAPRMLHFGWLCLILMLLVLEYFQRTGKGLWLLLPLFALWINLHGSWVFGLAVMGIYIVSGLVEGQWGVVVAERWTPIQLRNLLLSFVASVVALLANPYGYELPGYPFDLLFRQKMNLDNMGEWRSVDFHSGWGKLALFMILALLAASWFSRKPWKLRDILLAAFAVWASLNHLRFLLFAAIILVPILAPRLSLFAPYDGKKDKAWLNLAISVAIVGIIMGSFPRATPLQEHIDSLFPHDALRFMQQKQITGRLFNWYDYGGYIEFYAPAIKTFADGRTDIFVYNGVLEDYIRITSFERPLELLDKYNIDYVMFPVDHRLTYVLDHSARWRTIYQDKVVKLYEREPAAARPF